MKGGWGSNSWKVTTCGRKARHTATAEGHHNGRGTHYTGITHAQRLLHAHDARARATLALARAESHDGLLHCVCSTLEGSRRAEKGQRAVMVRGL